MAEENARKHFDKDAEEYDGFIPKVVPYYYEKIMALVNALPFPDDSSLEILDLGSGTGAVTRVIKERYPEARVTCLDVSENMLAKAEERLNNFRGITFVPGDFNSIEYEEEYDAVVTSLALHHLGSEAKKLENYRRIYRALKPGGVFYNADVVAGPGSYLEALYIEKWKEFMRKSFSEEEIENEWLRRHAEEDHPVSLHIHFKLLQEAGFKEIEVVWKYYHGAVFGGVR